MDSMGDRRREFTKREIVRAAMVLFGERGLSAVTVEEIADAAQISTRTFFRYFRTKEDVVLEVERRVRNGLARALSARPLSEPPIEALRNAYLSTSSVPSSRRRSMIEYHRIRQEQSAIAVRGNGEIVFDSVIVGILAERMGVDPLVDERPAMIAAMMAAAVVISFGRWVEAGAKGDLLPHIRDAIASVEAGLAAMDTGPRRRR